MNQLIPTHEIFEIVFKICDVTPKQYHTENTLKVIHCRSVMISMLKRFTPKTTYQIADVMETTVLAIINHNCIEKNYIVGGDT